MRSAELDDFTRRLDAASAAIREAEAYLDRSGFREKVSSPAVPGSLDEWLTWELVEPPRRWRITYRGLHQQGGEVRPLIEMPGHVRLRAAQGLPLLLSTAGRQTELKEE